jgi:hypothetical protein
MAYEDEVSDTVAGAVPVPERGKVDGQDEAGDHKRAPARHLSKAKLGPAVDRLAGAPKLHRPIVSHGDRLIAV